MRKAEVIFGTATILVAVLFIALAGSFPDSRGDDVGMAFYPRMMGFIIIALSTVVIFQSFRKKPETSTGEKEEPFFDIEDKGIYRVLVMIAMTLFYASVLGVLGFLVITPIYLIVLMFIFKAGSVKRILLVSVLTTLAIYIVFQRLLLIPLPTGIFYT